MTTLASPRVDDLQFEAVYEQYFGLLVQIAVFKFRVPESEAEGLTHDVLISYLRKSATVLNLRSWLIGAICYASRHYWRLNGRIVPAEDPDIERANAASLHIADSLTDQLAVREALECLTPRCQQVLQMRYFEGCTLAEVADRLGIKTKSAQKLIARCLRRAERLYREKGRAK
jgi:RNA polymerase sigma factor (sigma-70 family)